MLGVFQNSALFALLLAAPAEGAGQGLRGEAQRRSLSDDGSVHACVTNNEYVRFVESENLCDSYENHVHFNAAGLVGKVGLRALSTGKDDSAASYDGDVIHVCMWDDMYIRLVSGKDMCEHSETYVHWNVQGPQGDDGHDGKDGAKGMLAWSALAKLSLFSYCISLSFPAAPLFLPIR